MLTERDADECNRFFLANFDAQSALVLQHILV